MLVLFGAACWKVWTLAIQTSLCRTEIADEFVWACMTGSAECKQQFGYDSIPFNTACVPRSSRCAAESRRLLPSPEAEQLAKQFEALLRELQPLVGGFRALAY
jgi:hypothetical protein